mgnify:CR=1 FL=1
MKVGDVVIFSDLESVYAKWFYGQIGIVKSCGRGSHCRVTWMQPVKYFNSFATFSDFPVKNFEISK